MSRNKELALANFLGIDIDDNEIRTKSYSKNYLYHECTFYVGKKGEFLVCTDDEADILWEDCVRDYVNEIKLTDIYNYERYLNEEYLWDSIKEDKEGYVSDIEYEKSLHYKNRLIEELCEVKLLSEEDFEQDEDGCADFFRPLESVNIYEKKNEYVEFLLKEIPNCVEYIKLNFGKEHFNDFSFYQIFDMDKFVRDSKQRYSRSEDLGYYDGKEHIQEIGNETYYIYTLHPYKPSTEIQTKRALKDILA